jgi:hypothetical protein
MSDEMIGEKELDIEAIDHRNQQRKGGSGHSPTCIGWTADPSGEFMRASCSCAVGFIESDVDDLLSEVRRLRSGSGSGSH